MCTPGVAEVILKVIALKHTELMALVHQLRTSGTQQVVPMVGISQALILIVLHLGDLLLQAI